MLSGAAHLAAVTARRDGQHNPKFKEITQYERLEPGMMRTEHTTKRTTNAQESHAMTPEAMRLVVAGTGYSLAELSRCMGVPYRTMQDYYYGKRSIPAEFSEKLRAEAEKIVQIRNEVFAGIDQAAAKVPLIRAVNE